LDYLLNHPWKLGILLTVILAFVLEMGRVVAVRLKIDEVPERSEQMKALRDGLLVLLSFLLGFTLSLADARYSERRALLVQEAVSIGTTYLRAGTLLPLRRDRSRQLLREYIDSRIELNRESADAARLETTIQRSKRLQQELWSEAVGVSQDNPSAITAGYVTSLVETIDLHERRLAASEHRLPKPIWALIFCVSLLAVFTRGCTLKSRFWLTFVLAPVSITIVVALTADLDTSRGGFVRLDDQSMQRLQADMK
jgi:hypothetical protein